MRSSLRPAPRGYGPPSPLQVQVRKRRCSGRSPLFQLAAGFAASPGVTVIVGHSGAGKTTILRCIAGLCDPDEGRITVGDRVLFDSTRGIRLAPALRRVAFVFQDLALFPHLSVQDNVMYGLRRLDRPERERRMREVLESFQIAHLRYRSPRDISGGERQRVALARSLVTEPSVLLLDEPLSSLDPRTKVRIIEDLQRWNHAHSIPILYVTHDYGEVLAMADRVIALDQGRVVAEGHSLDVVTAPPRAALAQTEGFENLFDATVHKIRGHGSTMVCQLTGTSILLDVPLAQASIGSEVCIGIRADDILVSTSPPAILSECNVIPGRIKWLERIGAAVEARIGGNAEFRARMNSHHIESRGVGVSAEVWMMIGAHACHLVRPTLPEPLSRLFVFICHGNTVRSPMAQAICNAEISGRLGVPLETLDELGIKAMSAGLTARPGEPIAVEAVQALGKIGIPASEHRSRNLTHRLAQRAEAIFCMTEEQRRELVTKFPATQSKSHRLHPEADIGEPHGKGLDGFLDCALQIQELVRRRLNWLDIRAGTGLELT